MLGEEGVRATSNEVSERLTKSRVTARECLFVGYICLKQLKGKELYCVGFSSNPVFSDSEISSKLKEEKIVYNL